MGDQSRPKRHRGSSRRRVPPAGVAGGPGDLERSWVDAAIRAQGDCHCGSHVIVTEWEPEGGPIVSYCLHCGCHLIHWDGLVPILSDPHA